MKIRTFLALELSHTLRNKLSVHAEMISRYDNMQEIRWVSVENYHLTLVYLGDVEHALLSRLNLELEQILTFNKAVPFKFSEIAPLSFFWDSKDRCGDVRAIG